jgi:hypothetical protein
MQLKQAIFFSVGNTKQEADNYDRRFAIEASLWTKPILTALENSVKNGKGLTPNAYFAKYRLFTMKEA